ncbi:MAG: RidA family protein [Bacteroidales bacterium]|nr:RidA family protein [Bacteroidales bacterium]
MKKKIISSSKVPTAIGPYSHAVEVNGFLFASGQLGIDPATSDFVEGGIKEQTEQALKNVSNLLADAGYYMDNVVKTTVFLQDMSMFADMNEIYAKYFKFDFPARSAVAVKTLPKGGLVEIEVIASK